MMKNDPIVEETRKTRHDLFEKCDNNLDKYLEWLKSLEEQHEKQLLSFEEIQANRKQETTF